MLMNDRISRTKLLCAALCATSIAMAQVPSYKPAKGFVPDEKTAIAIAEAVLKPVYGDEHIRGEEPFHATLKGDVWTVDGYLPPNMAGGVATVQINRIDGRILYMMHGK
jgi:hypothetical protein